MNSPKQIMIQQPRRGFTLIEVLLVLAILGVIMALVVPQLLGTQQQALIDSTKLSIKGVEQGLQMYALDHDGQLPTTSEGLQVLIENPGNDTKWKKPYLDDTTMLPKDAWGNPFQYESPGPNHLDGLKADIWSFGPDKQDGTDDDIDNWTVKSE